MLKSRIAAGDRLVGTVARAVPVRASRVGVADSDLPQATAAPTGLTIQGTTLRARDLDDKAEIVAGTIKNVWPMLEDGRVKHALHGTYPLADAAQAHAALDSGEVTGTLVLTV